jgi:hypothetical protein
MQRMQILRPFYACFRGCIRVCVDLPLDLRVVDLRAYVANILTYIPS